MSQHEDDSGLNKKKLRIDNELWLAYAESKPENPAADQTLLFIPGFTFSGEVFCHQLQALSNEYHVIVLDPRSHGDSTITSLGNDYSTHASDLQTFIEKLELDHIVLIGWSFGAITTYGYSALDTDRLKAHVCIDRPLVSISANEENGDWVEGKIADVAMAYHSLRSTAGQASFIEEYARQVMVERELTRAELDWLVGLSLRTPYPIAASLFASGLFSNSLEQAKMLEQKIPNRFYIASHWAEVACPYLTAELPSSSIATFGGHMMFWEYPEKFNDDLKTFILSL